jgi:glycosyltransferase involved in cell wall biosynthesis
MEPDIFLPGNDPKTFISVIIPFLNEQDNIGTVVNSLNSQTRNPGNFEVIFVNDGSVDNTISVIRGQAVSFNYRIVDNDSRGKKAALRTGLRYVKGNIVIIADADCTYPDKWLETIAKYYDREQPDMIIMPVRIMPGNSFLQHFQSIDFLALQLVGAGSALSGDPLMCNGANLSFKKPTDMPDLKDKYVSGEDMFLLEWMKKNDKKIKYLKSKDVTAETGAAKTIRQFLRQRARWISKAGGYGDIPLVFISLLFFAANLILLILLIAGFISKLYFVLWGVFFFVKILLDHSLISSGAVFFNIRVSLLKFMLMQFIYPFYMITVSVKGLLFPIRWR